MTDNGESPVTPTSAEAQSVVPTIALAKVVAAESVLKEIDTIQKRCRLWRYVTYLGRRTYLVSGG